jgi:hypothetical protein
MVSSERFVVTTEEAVYVRLVEKNKVCVLGELRPVDR